MSEFHERLIRYLQASDQPFKIQQLTPDASTREYFRVFRDDATMIACVYPEPFSAKDQSYLDVTALFLKAGLPVAKIIDFDESLGIVLIEDLGDTILRDVLVSTSSETRDALLDGAIGLIARIQAATETAYATNSIASRLRFDEEKLLWELEFFREHYFTTYLKKPLSAEENAGLRNEFIELSRELESKASVLCHRDFHAANLMVATDGHLRIIDHQDARIGSTSYDLVSLLLDRVTEPPSAEWLANKRRLFLNDRTSLGLAPLSDDDFAYEFRLQTIQRCLKAVGTFSFQSATRGKSYFEPFILPMFEIVTRAIESLDRFPILGCILHEQIDQTRK
jgi:aminoglycoside/choline kinase family phosphotransferase